MTYIDLSQRWLRWTLDSRWRHRQKNGPTTVKLLHRSDNFASFCKNEIVSKAFFIASLNRDSLWIDSTLNIITFNLIWTGIYSGDSATGDVCRRLCDKVMMILVIYSCLGGKCVKTGLSGRIRLNYRPFNCCYFCRLRLIFPVYGVRSSWHCETNERYHKPFILKVRKLNLIIIIIIITLKYTNFPESWRSIGNQI